MQTLGSSDNGKEVQLIVRESFAVELSENPTTGFRWAIAKVPPILELASDHFDPPPSSTPGAPGLRRWSFAAVGAGTGELRLELQARTARSAEPVAFTLLVDVDPA